jgi:hypothetical protein
MSTTPSPQVTSNELQQVVAYILDIAAMTATITALLEKEMAGFAKEMLEIDGRFPGFGRRLRRRVGREIERTISRRVSVLRHEFEEFLKSRLTPDDIKTALAFQRERVVAELRHTAFIKSLEMGDRADRSLSARVSAEMNPEQHAVVARFLQSPCGRKLTPLTQQMETLKYGWMQTIATDVSQRLPGLGKDILQKHYIRAANF